MKQPVTGGKSSVAKANGSGKPMRQIETSMSKKYKGTPKVSQTTIDSIKKMGMTAALKKAGTSKNPEYIEGIRRMYGAKRLAAAQGGVKKAATAGRSFSPAQKNAMGMGAAKKAAPAAKKSAPAAAKNSLSAADAAYNKWRSGDRYSTGAPKKKSTYKAPKPTAQQVAQAKARAGGNSAKYTPGAGR